MWRRNWRDLIWQGLAAPWDLVVVGGGITGAAIEIGKRGDADVVFVHAKEQELKAVNEGYFVNRHDVMYNDFVIIGPANDPAGIAKSRTAAEAMKRLADDCLQFGSLHYDQWMAAYEGLRVAAARLEAADRPARLWERLGPASSCTGS